MSKPHYDDRLYQFRAPLDLEFQIRGVWDDKLNRTANIIKIMRRGIAAISTKEATNE